MHQDAFTRLDSFTGSPESRIRNPSFRAIISPLFLVAVINSAEDKFRVSL
jgi:hypothetical protein